MARKPPIRFASRCEVARQRILRWLATDAHPWASPFGFIALGGVRLGRAI